MRPNVTREAIEWLAKKHRIDDRRELASAVYQAEAIYRDPEWYRWETLPDNLDKLVEHIDRLERLLLETSNLMLGSHAEASDIGRLADRLAEAEGCDREAKFGEVWDLSEHLGTELVDRLRRVRWAAKAGHRARSRGRPQPEDLHQVVSALARYWVDELKQPAGFTNLWKGQQPISKAACFVTDVVKLIDSKRVPELPTAMKRVVTTRKRHQSSFPKIGQFLPE